MFKISTYNFISNRIAEKMKQTSANITQNSLQRNCSHYFSQSFPDLPLFLTRLFNLHTADFQQTLSESLTLGLFESVFPSGLRCDSLLVGLVISKGKLLSL